MQLIQCEGEVHVHDGREYGEHTGPCGSSLWTGWTVGEMEAIERGWFSVFSPPWTRCGADTPDAVPDLNRVFIELRWDAATQRMVDR